MAPRKLFFVVTLSMTIGCAIGWALGQLSQAPQPASQPYEQGPTPARETRHRASEAGSSGPNPKDSTTRPDLRSSLTQAMQSLQSPEGLGVEEASKAIQTLASAGEAALPLIEALLRSGVNRRYVALCPPGQSYDKLPSVRIGLIAALRSIEGQAACEVAMAALADVQDSLEVYEVSQVLLGNGVSLNSRRSALMEGLSKHLVRMADYIEKAAELRELVIELGSQGWSQDEIKVELESRFGGLSAASSPAFINSHGLEYDMLHQLEGVSENETEILRTGHPRGLELLAVTLPPAEALKLLAGDYSTATPRQKATLISGIAAIGSSDALSFLESNLSRLDKYGQIALVSGLGAGLGVTGGYFMEVLVDQFDYTQRRAVYPRRSSREDFVAVQRFLEQALQSGLASSSVSERAGWLLGEVRRHLKVAR